MSNFNHYESPNEILHDAALTKNQKIKLLETWAHDELEKAHADEENMHLKDQEDEQNRLQEIHLALAKLKK